MIGVSHVGDFDDGFGYKLPHLRGADQVAAGSLRNISGAIARIQHNSDCCFNVSGFFLKPRRLSQKHRR
jgi:hypothetical protein